ncbi:four-helix bundle copper-binding protein [Nocardia otitidiscaviarum]|uniref:four-helix bundle copper-binding protein n=1 Tax=Nocardia otitidiscaviarum TaxID=1823 RepID=UPI002456EFC2|nr:four-helix bundle copper-binding protein [Nocardia otitidiscaviarum]
MSTVAAMVDSHPANRTAASSAQVIACIEACWRCAESCTVCADACLSEEGLAELRECIRTDLDCADICHTTAAVLSRRGGGDPATIRSLLDACALICERCGQECDRHADRHEHCRICAETCLRCARSCRELLAALS